MDESTAGDGMSLGPPINVEIEFNGVTWNGTGYSANYVVEKTVPDPAEATFNQLLNLLPDLRQYSVRCPGMVMTRSENKPFHRYPCDMRTSLAQTIVHLNDYHKWPRELIADWLDEVGEEEELDLTITPPKE